MQMPGRKFSTSKGTYPYGFNGKQKSDEILGEGNAYNFGARIQDPRLGRFLSTDPLASINPGESPYTFAGNSPIGLTDFEGLFKISPYFVKKYPTLAKILKNVLPSYIKNTTARDGWIRAVGFKDRNKGIAAWEEMLTYGKGPWITPQMSEAELKKNGGRRGLNISLGRFGEGSGNQWDNDEFPNNISFSNESLSSLEAALKYGNDEDVAFNALKTMILIMHESGHWARLMQAGLPNRTSGPYEDGAIVEEYTFGVRYSYTNRCPPGIRCNEVDAIRNDKISATANGIMSTFKFLTGKTVTNVLRNLKTPSGQTGDPVLKGAKINERVFTPSSTNDTGGGTKKADTSY